MLNFDPNSRAADDRALTPTTGLVTDIVGYGRRNLRGQQDIQERLPQVIRKSLIDVGVETDRLYHSEMAGDSMSVFLPVATDPTRVLPCLLMAMASRLADDNERYKDRMRIRMSVGFGLIGRGPGGLLGRLIIDLNRLIDSLPIRQAVIDHPMSDLFVLVSQALYKLVNPPSHLGSELPLLSRVEVSVNEYSEPAWLWTSPGQLELTDH